MDTLDVPGAYLHVDMPNYKRVLMNFRFFFDIMCQVKPEYEQHVRYENGEKVLKLLLRREIYGCIESALLWYNLFSTTLEGLVF